MGEEERDALVHVERGWEALEGARLLLSEGLVGEAGSRAYYAMHRGARALLIERGEEPRTHRGLLHQLRELFVLEGELDEDVLRWLQRGMEIREAADYGLEPEADEETVRELVDRARSFLELVEARLSG